MLNPIFLNTFIALAEKRHFTAVANALNMTQPGVSQHLRALEEQLGVILMHRSKRGGELTEAGKKLLAYALRWREEQQKFLRHVKVDDPHSGYCRFASPGSFGLLLHDFLLRLNKPYPDLAFHLEASPNYRVIPNLMSDEIDIGFMSVTPSDPQVNAEIIAQEQLMILVPPRWRDFSFEGLARLGFINHPDGKHHAGRILAANFSDQFADMNAFQTRGYCNQIGRILEPVALGIGWTALPEYACREYLRKKRVAQFPLAVKVHDNIYQVSKKHMPLSARFTFIMQRFRAHLAELDAIQ